jgi:hypothetical protein
MGGANHRTWPQIHVYRFRLAPLVIPKFDLIRTGPEDQEVAAAVLCNGDGVLGETDPPSGRLGLPDDVVRRPCDPPGVAGVEDREESPRVPGGPDLAAVLTVQADPEVHRQPATELSFGLVDESHLDGEWHRKTSSFRRERLRFMAPRPCPG